MVFVGYSRKNSGREKRCVTVLFFSPNRKDRAVRFDYHVIRSAKHKWENVI